MPFFSTLQPKKNDLWLVPLGGCGEIGMNMNLYGHDGQWLMVDCGISFQRRDGAPPSTPNDVYAADPSFISQQRDRLAGIVITHAHEDHVGGLPYLWPRLRAPIYTTSFTAEVLRRKLSKAQLLEQVEIIEVDLNGSRQIGAFQVDWVGLTHSLPEAQGLVITTAAGKVFHTGDWKLDKHPVVGPTYSDKRLKQLAKEHIRAMVCDSTNACISGWSRSESELYAGLKKAIGGAAGRVVAACFGSNIARLHTLANIAKDTQRNFGTLGRSLNNMVSIARQTGYWPDTLPVVQSHHLGYLPRNKVLVAATGSQGEGRTALARLAADDHFDMDLERGDTVIFSSRVIPGNEAAVVALINRLRAKGVTVIDADVDSLPIHASGHPHEEELRSMYNWVQPEVVIPVHGEAKHMEANAEIAKGCAVPKQLLGNNGDIFVIAPKARVRTQAVNSGQICVSRE